MNISEIAVDNDSCEASGHPSECTEPAPGNVDVETPTNIRINGTEIGVKEFSSMFFPSHGHDTDEDNDCTDFQEHNIQIEENRNIKVNGEIIMVRGDTGTDPGSDGEVVILE